MDVVAKADRGGDGGHVEGMRAEQCRDGRADAGDAKGRLHRRVVAAGAQHGKAGQVLRGHGDEVEGQAEADERLAEYRERLKEAREQADDILGRAKKAGDSAKNEATEEGRAKREELISAAKKDIEAETKRSLEKIRKEIADLTVLATERVTRKSLSGEDHKRLVEEALNEVDFSALAGDAGTRGE